MTRNLEIVSALPTISLRIFGRCFSTHGSSPAACEGADDDEAAAAAAAPEEEEEEAAAADAAAGVAICSTSDISITSAMMTTGVCCQCSEEEMRRRSSDDRSLAGASERVADSQKRLCTSIVDHAREPSTALLSAPSFSLCVARLLPRRAEPPTARPENGRQQPRGGDGRPPQRKKERKKERRKENWRCAGLVAALRVSLLSNVGIATLHHASMAAADRGIVAQLEEAASGRPGDDRDDQRSGLSDAATAAAATRRFLLHAPKHTGIHFGAVCALVAVARSSRRCML